MDLHPAPAAAGKRGGPRRQKETRLELSYVLFWWAGPCSGVYDVFYFGGVGGGKGHVQVHNIGTLMTLMKGRRDPSVLYRFNRSPEALAQDPSGRE